MGQKVNPIGFRLGVNRDWRSRWYASPQEMPAFLEGDLAIREYVKKKLQFAAVAKIIIERAWNSIRVTIHTARPGIVIGRKGTGINQTFTVRRISYGEGVERVFPVHSPRIAKVEVEKQGKARRAKLNYLRERKGKEATAVRE